MLSRCKIRVEPGSRSLFRVLLDSGKALWLNDELREQMGSLLADDIEEWTGGGAFFAMPLRDGTRRLGLLYAGLQGQDLRRGRRLRWQALHKEKSPTFFQVMN